MKRARPFISELIKRVVMKLTAEINVSGSDCAMRMFLGLVLIICGSAIIIYLRSISIHLTEGELFAEYYLQFILGGASIFSGASIVANKHA